LPTISEAVAWAYFSEAAIRSRSGWQGALLERDARW
jgi:hypothetical protein